MTLSSISNTKNYVVYSRIASGQNTAKAHGYSDSPSAFSIVETVCRNVKRWRPGDQIERWAHR